MRWRTSHSQACVGNPFVSRPRTLLTQSAGKFYEVDGGLSSIETTPRLLKLISARNLCLVLVIRERVSVWRKRVEGGGRGKEEKLGGPSIFFGWNMGGLKMLKDDLGGGVFKFLLSSIPTEQHDA